MKRSFAFSIVGAHNEYLRIDDCNEDGSEIAATLYLGPNRVVRFRCTDGDIQIYAAENLLKTISLRNGDTVNFAGTPITGTAQEILEGVLANVPANFY